MAFRKRNIAVSKSPNAQTESDAVDAKSLPGIRPSFLTSQPTTSTGCSSLDSLLGGHGGLALGSSLLVEESGTTDFAGALLKYYAAEGICHGHVLHVIGVGDGWVRELPGIAEEKGSARREKEESSGEGEKMKIAWRYERLGQAGERALPNRSAPASTTTDATAQEATAPFCHTFDLTKRLAIPTSAKVNHIPIPTNPTSAPFDTIINGLRQSLRSSAPDTIHRLIIPTVLSPALYPPQANRPEHLLRFLHALRALLRHHPTQLAAMLTLPLSLHPRPTALARWAEILSDGVLELTPFPHLMDTPPQPERATGSSKPEEQPQGLLRVHKLPVTTERGEGGAGAGNSVGEDLAFTVSRRKFVVRPYSLPPVEGDQEGQEAAGAVVKAKDVEF